MPAADSWQRDATLDECLAVPRQADEVDAMTSGWNPHGFVLACSSFPRIETGDPPAREVEDLELDLRTRREPVSDRPRSPLRSLDRERRRLVIRLLHRVLRSTRERVEPLPVVHAGLAGIVRNADVDGAEVAASAAVRRAVRDFVD